MSDTENLNATLEEEEEEEELTEQEKRELEAKQEAKLKQMHGGDDLKVRTKI